MPTYQKFEVPTAPPYANATEDGSATNTFIRMTTTFAAAAAGVPRQRLDFVYDSQGRRVSKTVSTSPDGNTWTLATDRRFLYDGWNLIAEYSAPLPTSTVLSEHPDDGFGSPEGGRWGDVEWVGDLPE